MLVSKYKEDMMKIDADPQPILKQTKQLTQTMKLRYRLVDPVVW